MVFRVYQFLNILSLDVAGGAVICAAFFARLLGVPLLPYGLLSLGLTVWIIYTVDHLLDARKINKMASTKRHRFHQQHFKLLFVLVLLAAILDGWQLLYIKRPVFIGGLLLACVVVVYFFIQRRLTFLKEIFGAILYTGGVLLVPLSVTSNALTASQIIFIGLFFLTALNNLFLFSWFDYAPDTRDNHHSLTIALGERETKKIIIVVFSIVAILIVIQRVMAYSLFAEAIIAFMNLILFLIFSNKKYFEYNDRYRLMGDAIFLVPLIFILT